jgi:DNA-binding transcriptional regulator/RsmH inhibitor MraZ
MKPIMFVSEDGTVTGSINLLELWGVEAHTAEAQTQLDRLMAEAGEDGWEATAPPQPEQG